MLQDINRDSFDDTELPDLLHSVTTGTNTTPSSTAEHCCVPCDRTFDSAFLLRVHNRRWHIKPNDCKYCTLSYEDKPHLERHIRSQHSQHIQDPYICPHQDCVRHKDPFTRKDLLRNHLNTKHDGTPHSFFVRRSRKKISRYLKKNSPGSLNDGRLIDGAH